MIVFALFKMFVIIMFIFNSTLFLVFQVLPFEFPPSIPQMPNVRKKEKQLLFCLDAKSTYFFCVLFRAGCLFSFSTLCSPFFSFPPSMPILSHPRILCHLCSRTCPHRQARSQIFYYFRIVNRRCVADNT